MRVKVLNILYIIFAIIGVTFAYIYFRCDLSSFHKNIIININYSIAAIVGCLILVETRISPEIHQKLGEKFLGIVLLIIGLSKVFLMLKDILK